MLVDVGVERGHLAGAHEVRRHVGDQHEVVLLELLGGRREAARAAHLDVDVLVLERAAAGSRRCPARAGRRPRRRGRSACPSPARSSPPRCSASRCPSRTSTRRSRYVVAPARFASVLNLTRFLPSRSSTVLRRLEPFGNSSCWSASVDVLRLGRPHLGGDLERLADLDVVGHGHADDADLARLVLVERAPRDLDAELLGAIGLDREVALRSGCRRRRSPCAAGSRRDRGRTRAASRPACRCRRRRRRGA